MPRHYPNLYTRTYATQTGTKRTLYYCQFTDWKGIRRTFPAGDQLAPALTLRNKLLGQNVERFDFDQIHTRMTFAAWAQHWLALTRHKHSHRQDILRARYLTDFFGDVPLTALTTSRVEAYKQHRLESSSRYGKPPAPASINRELALLRAMLRLAVRDDLLRKSPTVTLFAENNERSRIVSPEEFEAIATAFPADLQAPWLLAGYTGMRIGEVIGLSWPMVDLAERLLTLERTENKEKKRKQIPLNQAASVLLEAQWTMRPSQDPTAAVFWHNGKPLTYHAFSHYFRRQVVPALGLTGLWIHDLRGTFITQKVAQKWDRQLIKAITGHRTDVAFNRYLRPSLDLLRQVVADDVPTKPSATDPDPS